MSLTAIRGPSPAGGVSVMKTPGGLFVGIGLALTGPGAGQVVPADRAVAVHRDARDAEDDALHCRGREHAPPRASCVVASGGSSSSSFVQTKSKAFLPIRPASTPRTRPIGL